MSTGPGLIDRSAILAGALLALAVAVPVLVAGVVIDPDEQSNVVLVLWAAVMVGFALGGRRAARRRPDAPFSNGATAALVAYAAILIVTSIIRVARGTAFDLTLMVFNGFMAATFGIIGGLVAGWRGPSPRDQPPNRP